MFGNAQILGNQPNRPRQPPPPLRSRLKRQPKQSLLDWKAQFFLAKGWQSKVPVQTQMRNEMKVACDQVESSVLQQGIGPNCFDTLSDEKLDPGKEFKSYLASLSYFEKADPKTRPGLVDGLREAAQAYIDHFNNDYSKRQKKQKQNIRKKAVCEGTLSDLRKFDLRDELDAIPDPPWDTETSMKASALKVSLDIEGVPPGTKGVEKNGGVHEFPAFWINKKGNNGNGSTDKSYLFKPTINEGVNGFDPGGDTVRESAVGRMGDLLNGMTGLDFGVPETHVVSVGKDKLPDGPLGKGVAPPVGENYVGSVQQFATSGGELREQPREEIEKVSAKSCQKMTILDMLTLNLDRHGGNLLVKPGQGNTPDLVPIDHGQSFPPQNDLVLSDMANKLGDRHCATLSLPGSHEPFTDEMLEAIGKIDPDAMAAGMKREVATISKAHPSTAGKITDESIEMSRRSAKFLKLAVANDPKLTPAAAQVAFGQNAEALLAKGVNEQKFEQMAAEIIAKAAGNQEGLAEYFLLAPEMQNEIHTTLANNGWPIVNGVLDRKWLLSNTKLALDLARGDVKHPGKMKELEDVIGKKDLNERLQQKTLSQLYSQRYNLVERPPLNGDEDDYADKVEQTFKGDKVRRELPASLQDAAKDWRDFEALGGLKALDEAIKTLQLNGPQEVRARTKITDALAAMRDVVGMKAGAITVAKDNADVKAVAVELDFVKRVAADLPPNSPLAGTVDQFGDRNLTGSAKEKKILRTLRVKVIDAVRADALRRLKVVEKRIETALENAEGDDARDIGYDLADLMEEAVGVASGVVLGAKGRVENWEGKYPN